MRSDRRGVFTEVFRESWDTGIRPVQWNLVRSEPKVLRGVHVHVRHSDYFVLVNGRVLIGLCDLRQGSPTERAAALIELDGEKLQALTIPPGVAHGFYFIARSQHLYSVSRYWDTADELACQWADPGLGIPWPFDDAVVSERDAGARSLAELLDEIAPYQPIRLPLE